MSESLESAYPHVARWVQTYGWIEIGDDECSRSQVRALDIGGMVWESTQVYATPDEIMQALDAALAEFMREELGER